ncbi:hypothetical protein GWK08_00640 [Leptobacterium flavescens]|uniref:Uncharacterized protein n=1 Tax=Leptobacterium flavescens TaxID=472055 RepID=A0A6P0ULK3_9FLAO|nr:DUF6090 family protein [Leptobacterium flavescens]NER11933.1 hypothetical protein [Leptobacterium flavescens]
MTNKKIKNYFSYAFGEVILVTVGILIALQIGKLAENIKKSEQEQVLLDNLLIDIRHDVRTLDSLAVHVDGVSRRLASVAFAKTPTEVLDVVQSARYDYMFQPQNGTFEEAKSIGSMGLIKNGPLRNRTFRYYLAVERNIFLNESSSFKYNHEFVTPQIDEKILASKEYFEVIGVPSQLPPLNMQEIIQDRKLTGALINRVKLLNSQIRAWQRLSAQAKDLVKQLETELGKEE